MSKKICFIANPSFGKSKEEDLVTVEQLNKLIDFCNGIKCKDIVICGGMYNFSRRDINNVKLVQEEIEHVSRILPTNLNIRYKILSGADEIYVLRKNLINMNHDLAKNREDVEHLGYDRAEYNDILIKCLYGKQNNLGFNEGEIASYKGHIYDPSIRLEKIIKDYDKDLVLIGGRNRYEEFIYDDKIVIALQSIVNPYSNGHSPDLGFVIVDKGENSLDVKPHVKELNRKPSFK